MMDMWDTLVATALMGTDRKTPDLSGSKGDLGALFTQLETEEVSGQLLAAASAIAVSNQAGIQPVEFQGALPRPSAEDSQPSCHEQVHHVLQTVLHGTHAPVLPELLNHIQQSGQRVSDLSLPTLLNLGRQRKELRRSLRHIIGKKGQWLAQQNPDWAYIHGKIEGVDAAGTLQPELATAQWETGTRSTRLALLERLRKTDATFAQTLLASSWKKEQAKDRAAFLQSLKPQLSLDDEAFLEAALTDRSKDVRAIAADLLAHLPTSQLCLRMTERIQALISIQPQEKGIKMAVTLPETTETGDGLIASKANGLGPRSSLLMQMIGAVPLSYWDASPEEFITAAKQQDTQTAILKGWILAAIRQQDRVWAAALMAHFSQTNRSADYATVADLSILLSPSEREMQLEHWVERLGEGKDWKEWRICIPHIIQVHPFPSLTFSQTLLHYFEADLRAEMVDKTKKYPHQLRSLSRELGYYLHPDSVSAGVKLVERLKKQGLNRDRESFLEDWLDILSFRQTMTQLFTHS